MVDFSENLVTTKGVLSAIALGNNLGDSLAILEAALKTIDRTPDITFKLRSSWYISILKSVEHNHLFADS